MTLDEQVMADHEVEGNARITGLVGAILLIVLAIEGYTLLDVRGMFTLHVFIGLFVIPMIFVKIGTTAFRFFRYYRGTEAYRRKGPPHPILRIGAPVVVVSTVGMLVAGVITLAVGPRHREPWLTIHQGFFAVWVVVTTVHVLGHALETWRLSRDDLVDKPPVPRRGARFGVILASLVVGLVVGILSLKWTGAWRNFDRIDD